MAKPDGPRVGGSNAKGPKGQALGHKGQVLHSGMGQIVSMKMWGRKARALSPTPPPRWQRQYSSVMAQVAGTAFIMARDL